MVRYCLRGTRTSQLKNPRELQIDAHSVTAEPAGMELSAKIGARIKSQREALGLTLADLCEKVPGLVVSTLGGYETGRRKADLEVYKKIAKALQMTECSILCIDEGPQNATEARLIALFRASDDRGKNTILQIAEIQPRQHLAQARGNLLHLADTSK